MSQYKKDDIIKCIVSGITKYGIFVYVDAYYSGLIHISEISNRFISDINKYVKIGEEIYCQVIGIDNKKNHLMLSIKDINYKLEPDINGINETRRGFLPLKQMLPKWIDETLKYYNDKKQ